MRETLKLSLRLFLFALVAALALAATNEITKDPIARQAVKKANAARDAVMPVYDRFDEMELVDAESYPDIEAVHSVVKDEQIIGYTFQISSTGYKGPIVMTLGISSEGAVSALSINSQSETAGLGSKVADEEFLSQFPGKPVDTGALASDVDTISGATVSSKAVLSGVDQAFRYAAQVLGIGSANSEAVPNPSADAQSGATSDAQSGATSDAQSGATSDAQSGATSDAQSGATAGAQSGAASTTPSSATSDTQTGATTDGNGGATAEESAQNGGAAA
ncbi:RnfABCDGE type electron transport complex subunit G [Eubacteriales bacterium OttesenSCG-928-N13]|nr:RnfABCDGE type electron transport complex subunit G [Eubacteriales bacterium OttesenSCG-928-N13]